MSSPSDDLSGPAQSSGWDLGVQHQSSPDEDTAQPHDPKEYVPTDSHLLRRQYAKPELDSYSPADLQQTARDPPSLRTGTTSDPKNAVFGPSPALKPLSDADDLFEDEYSPNESDHEGQSEEEQSDRFGRGAGMTALDEVEPAVPRYQQEYAIEQAQALSSRGGNNIDEEGAAEFARALDEDQDCGCRGVSSNCPCPAGQCKCTGCSKNDATEATGCHCQESGSNCCCVPEQCQCAGRNAHEGTGRGCGCAGEPAKCHCSAGQCGCLGCDHDDASDNKSVPMDIGKTPITPTFPVVGKIPGLGRLDPTQSTNENIEHVFTPTNAPRLLQATFPDSGPKSPIRNPACACICGEQCACSKGQCNCDVRSTSERYKPDRLVNMPLGNFIKKCTEENNIDTYRPSYSRSPVRRPVIHRSGTSSPLAPGPKMIPIDKPVKRPDTPRPIDDSIRQSVEPEGPRQDWYRHSTPAYEERSLSPSPLSRQGDIHMRDATPTFVREGSMPPPSSPPRTVGSPSRIGHAPHAATNCQNSPHFLPRNSTPYLQRLSDLSPEHNLTRSSNPASSQAMRFAISYGPVIYKDGAPVTAIIHRSNGTEHYSTRPVGCAYRPICNHDRPTPSIPAPPIPTDSLKPTKIRKPEKSSGGRRKSGVANSGVKKPKSRPVSRKVTAKQTKPPKEKTSAQKVGEEGMVAAAVKKIEDEKKKREQREKEDRNKQQGDGTPVRRSGRIRELSSGNGAK